MTEKLANVPLGIMFHRFVPEGHVSQQGSLTAGGLRSIVESFRPGALIAPEEWIERQETGRLEGHRCLTFDDGLKRQVEFALPVLVERGISAFWFIPTGVLGAARPRAEVLAHALDEVDEPAAILRLFCNIAEEKHGPPDLDGLRLYSAQAMRRFPFYSDLDLKFRYVRNAMDLSDLDDTVVEVLRRAGFDADAYGEEVFIDADGIRLLHDSGQTIGLHSHSHPYDIAALPVAVQAEEYRRNSEELARLVGVTPTTVAHPLGSYSDETLAVLRSLDVVCGFRSEATAGFGITDGAGRLEYARVDAVAIGSAANTADFWVGRPRAGRMGNAR